MNKRKIRTVFFGTPVFAVLVLEALIVNEEIEAMAVVTQPDRPVGRKQEVEKSPVRRLAEVHGIKVFTPELSEIKGKNSEFRRKLKLLGDVDIGIVTAYGLIIPEEVLKLFKYRMLNIHPSLLPKYRGASPVAGAIINGETKSGVSIMQMTVKMDAGPVVAQWEEEVKPDDTGGGLTLRLFNQAAERLPEIVKYYCSSMSRTRIETKIRLLNSPAQGGFARRIRINFPPLPQDETQASYTRKLKKEHGYFPLKAVRAALEGKDYPIVNLKLAEAFPFLKKDMPFTERTPHLEEGEGEVEVRGGKNGSRLRLHSAKNNFSIAPLLERAIRALAPWPGVHTEVRIQKSGVRRLKLLKAHLEPRKPLTRNWKLETKLVLDEVQLEGKQPVSWQQFQDGYPGVVQ